VAVTSSEEVLATSSALKIAISKEVVEADRQVAAPFEVEQFRRPRSLGSNVSSTSDTFPLPPENRLEIKFVKKRYEGLSKKYNSMF
jgi:hypothetical protein